jgi:hypothetical protein
MDRSVSTTPPMTPAGPNDETLGLVRQNVRNLLTRSSAFRALPPAQQQAVAHDTVKVARYITDAGLGDQTPFTAIIQSPANERMADAPADTLARPFADPRPPPRPGAPSTGQRGFDPGTYDPRAANQAGNQMRNLANAVDFPGFCASLIEGVFTAIVKTSIQQMEAYAAMVANVAKTVDQYMADNVSEAQAKDQLVSAQPDLFQQDWSNDEPQVRPREDFNEDQMGGFLQSLGLPFDLDAGDEETMQQQIVPAMRKNIAMDRQKLLATMVLMGINRIVVTDGKIQASVMFDIDTTDVLEREQEIGTSFEQDYRQRHNIRKKDGWWIFAKNRESQNTRLNVTTDVTSDQTDESESRTELKAKLTGNVDLRFKSDYFPLEKMMDMLGTNETVITQVARQPTPSQSQQVPAVSAPAAPPMPPAPGFAGG